MQAAWILPQLAALRRAECSVLTCAHAHEDLCHPANIGFSTRRQGQRQGTAIPLNLHSITFK